MINEQIAEQLYREGLRVCTKLTKVGFHELFQVVHFAKQHLSQGKPLSAGISSFERLSNDASSITKLEGEENPLNAFLNAENDQELEKIFNKTLKKFGLSASLEKENGTYTVYFLAKDGVKMEYALNQVSQHFDDLKQKSRGLSTVKECIAKAKNHAANLVPGKTKHREKDRDLSL